MVFFVRPARLEELCDGLDGTDLAGEADLAIVVAGPTGACQADVAMVADPQARLADTYGLRRPRAGGHPSATPSSTKRADPLPNAGSRRSRICWTSSKPC